MTDVASTSMQLPPQSVQVPYSIAGCSEHSGYYVAENIRSDKPYDQTSRWSSSRDNSSGSKSWILLELESVSVLESITFGKYQRPHPCNMKDFEIHVGLSRDHLAEVLRSTLRNDSKAETFSIPHANEDGTPKPCKFVKIVSLSAHGQNFNTSIWHVALYGITDEQYVRRIAYEYEQLRERIAMRQILKHLRQRRHITTYRHLASRTGVQLEHPLISKLHESLVLRGDWAQVELHLNAIAGAGLFSKYIHSCTPSAKWKRIRATDANGDIPSRRGGHAMCLDEENGLIYLFGGYDGRKSLDDFWVYNIREDRWSVISHSVVEEKNGPGPRACHKMVYDRKGGYIYMLGRLADGDLPSEKSQAEDTSEGVYVNVPVTSSTSNGASQSAWRNRRSVGVSTAYPSGTPPPAAQSRQPGQDYFSEFYRYRVRGIDKGQWELVNVDTAIAGGPKLVYDHQLALDSEAQVLYVHGGRVVDSDHQTIKYSGLYSYDLRAGKWTMLQTNTPGESIFPPRFGHSMVFEPERKELFIFGGQKDDCYLSDMWEYNIPSKSLTELFQNFTASGGPEPCFSQRAVIDPLLKEIYVFAGLTKNKLSDLARTGSTVWLHSYHPRPGKWTEVLSVERTSSETPARLASNKRQRSDMEEDEQGEDDREEPTARCAHQMVYDVGNKTFYLHGGNAGVPRPTGSTERPVSEIRLDDFWSMTLLRPPAEEIVRRAIFEVRRQQFREMCEEVMPVKALAFLQNEVSAVVDHNNAEEATLFRSLLSHLLAAPPKGRASPDNGDSNSQGVSTPSSTDSGKDSAWTCKLPDDEDTVMGDVAADTIPLSTTTGMSVGHVEPETISEDQYELSLRAGGPLSDALFKQRTEVFESLLTFVDSEWRQPEGSLLDVLGDSEF